MSFTGSTSYYGIPYGNDGDLIEQPDNELQAQMSDWLLQAANGVAGNGVIEEGTYSQAPDSGSGNLILLNPSGGIAIKAAFRSALARTSSSIVWEGLSIGNFYYLYLSWNSTLYRDPSSFGVVSSITPFATTNNTYLLLATYDLTGGYPGILDTDPENKLYVSSFTEHINTKVDPHSPFLTQTNLTVTGSFWVGLDSANTMRIEQPSAFSTVPLMTLVHANSGVPLLYTEDEFVVQDIRMTTQLSELGQNSFDNGKSSIVGAINENTADIGTNLSQIGTNTTDISTNAGNISTNAGNISTNAGNISTNTGNIGTNTSNIADNTSDISMHLSDLANPHDTSISNINSGTLAQLNGKITDATLDNSSDPRDPNNHASNHTNGTDDIQLATNIIKGLASSAHITAIEANTTHRGSNGTDHSDVGLNNTHRGSNGTDHANVGLNDTHRGTTVGNPHNVIASETPFTSLSGLLSADVRSALDELNLKIEACCPTPSSSSSSS